MAIFGIVLLALLASVAIFVIIKKKFDILINPCFIFVAEWVLIVALNSLGLFGLYRPSNKVYAIIVVGVMSFILGYFLLSRVTKIQKIKNKQKKDYTIRYKLLYVLGILCIIYFSYFAIKSILNIIGNGASFNDIRVLAQAKGETSPFINFVFNFIVLPASYVIEILAVADVFRGKKDKKLFIIAILLIILRTISDGGRGQIVDFLLFLFIGHSLSRNKKHEKDSQGKRKFLRYSFVIIAALIVLLLIVTVQRSSSGVFRIMYFYLSMPPTMLDYWSNIIDSSSGQWFGLICANGLLFVVAYLIKNMFGFSSYPSFVKEPYDLIARTDSQWIAINNGGTTANAYVTIFWFLYADFGFAGVIVGCLLYGLVVRMSYNYEREKADTRSLAFYLFIFWTLFYSFIRLQFVKSYVIIMIVMLAVAFRPISKKKISNN